MIGPKIAWSKPMNSSEVEIEQGLGLIGFDQRDSFGSIETTQPSRSQPTDQD